MVRRYDGIYAPELNSATIATGCQRTIHRTGDSIFDCKGPTSAVATKFHGKPHAKYGTVMPLSICLYFDICDFPLTECPGFDLLPQALADGMADAIDVEAQLGEELGS